MVGDEIRVKNYFVRKNKATTIEGVGKLAPDAGKTGKVIFRLPYGRMFLIIYDYILLRLISLIYISY